METDIHRINGNMFEPIPLPLDRDDEPHQQQAPQYQQYNDYTPPPLDYSEKKPDFFADIDKKTWIFILIALILGFFMGKTMQIQPILMRSV